MNGLVPCVKFQGDVVQMLYGWNFSDCVAVTVMFQKVKHFICVDDDKNIFAWGNL